MNGTAKVIQGDALSLDLPDGSVDLIVTSPPYFGLRSYQDGGEHCDGQIGAETTPAEFVDALIAATAEMVRVLKPSGSIFVNLGDRYATQPAGNKTPTGINAIRQNWTSEAYASQMASPAQRLDYGVPMKSLLGTPWRYALRCVDDLGLVLRGEIIWNKTTGMPDSTRDRVRRMHEQWFHLVKSPRYYCNGDALRQINPTGAIPSSVWTVGPEPLKTPASLPRHTAAFPTEWPRRFINAWCPEGGTVLDPFGGTGTTALVAKALGRDGISVDLSADYCRIAEWRTNDPQQLEKAAALPKPPKAPKSEPEPVVDIDGQSSLLDMLGGDAA